MRPTQAGDEQRTFQMQNCIREFEKYSLTLAREVDFVLEASDISPNDSRPFSSKTKDFIDSLGPSARLSMYSKLYSAR